MRIVRCSLVACLSLLMIAPMASAQDHVINKSALDQAVQQRVSQQQADRDVIISVLHRADVREIASKAGLSVEKAEAAASTLQGKDLETAAAQARQVQNNLAGGSTIVISTTTIIIVLLLVILIVAIAN